jgi:hypothetical protein
LARFSIVGQELPLFARTPRRSSIFQVRIGTRFIGLSSAFEFDIDIEKDHLEVGIISYERLCKLDKLPHCFQFFGMPLSIRAGDGSPVRAFALLDESLLNACSPICKPPSTWHNPTSQIWSLVPRTT